MNDKKMPMKLKAQIYKTVVRPVMIYRVDFWALEMRVFRRILAVTL